MNSHSLRITALGAVMLVLQGCHEQRAPTEVTRGGVLVASLAPSEPADRYVVVFAAEQVPADFEARVLRLGGSVESTISSIGVATVIGLPDAAAAELRADHDVQHVEHDVFIVLPNDDVDIGETDAIALADASASPTAAQFYPRQWNMRAVFAPEAWAAGHLGSRDVVVAILDTGIDYLHPDLVGLVDVERSTSFVSAEEATLIAERFPGRLPFSDIRGHGTGVASIVASNATFLAGINRNVTLLAVKIFDGSQFSLTSVGRLLSGIVYAADHGADVINVSGGYVFDKSQNPGLIAAGQRAATYAFRRGALLVGAAGNDAADLDHDDDIVRMPCQAAHVICASATAPTGAATANGPWQDVDAAAPYSAFGRSAIDVAAPGGEIVARGVQGVVILCTTTPTEVTLFPPCRNGQFLSQVRGTSWSAPHVSGLAALLVAQLGKGNPALIRARILQSADDLGEPGVDPSYGHGRINIARALELR